MPEKKRFLLRVDPEIYAAVQRWADDEWRSVNAQIEYLLREALRRAGRLPRQSRHPGGDGGRDGGRDGEPSGGPEPGPPAG